MSGLHTASLPGLTFDRWEDRVVITLNRPEVRNAIDAEMVASLHQVCAQLEDDPSPAVITGGTEVFAAGADIAQLRERRITDALAGINSGIFHRISQLPMPVIAAISGHALGGGAELAYACDFRIGTPSTKIGNPEGQLGILAAAGACWRLIELVGEPLAKEVLLLGRVLDAEDARDCRLLSRVVPPEQLHDEAMEMVDSILRSAPLAVRLTKLAIAMPRDAHPTFDNVAQAVLFETVEKQQRMTAFLDRRSARQR